MFVKIKLICLFIFLSVCFCAQTNDNLNNHLSLKIAPFSLLDIYSGMSARIGIEYKIVNTLSLYNEFGTYISGPNSLLNNQGMLSKIELKKYFFQVEQHTGNYLSVELFYKHQKFNLIDSISLNTKYEKEYKVLKDVACFTIKYGKLSVYMKRLIVDAFVGVGLRYKVATNNLTKEENKNIVPIGDYHFNLFVGKAGKFFYPNFDLGIKIGYVIK